MGVSPPGQDLSPENTKHELALIILRSNNSRHSPHSDILTFQSEDRATGKRTPFRRQDLSKDWLASVNKYHWSREKMASRNVRLALNYGRYCLVRENRRNPKQLNVIRPSGESKHLQWINTWERLPKRWSSHQAVIWGNERSKQEVVGGKLDPETQQGLAAVNVKETWALAVNLHGMRSKFG